MNRREVILSAAGFLAAPAIVRATSLDFVPRADRSIMHGHLHIDFFQFGGRGLLCDLMDLQDAANKLLRDSFCLYNASIGRDQSAMERITSASFSIEAPLP